MTRPLRFGRKPARSGQAKSMVVFLHGYGADGADLLGLADVLAAQLPDTVFVAPDAPEQVGGLPFGYQWFSIPRFDGSSEEESQAGLLHSAELLNEFLDQQLEQEGLPPEALVLCGFSQGAMMALQVAPRRPYPLAGVIAISGMLIAPERLQTDTASRPPVLVMHGDEDEVVPFPEMTAACNALVSAGFETYGHVMEGSGHGIAEDGLVNALTFLRKVLPR